MFSQNGHDISNQDYREWNDQFKDRNVPMPETGVFAWRRQQLALNKINDMTMMPLPEAGPNLLQHALAALRKGLSIHISVRIDLNIREAANTGAIAK